MATKKRAASVKSATKKVAKRAVPKAGGKTRPGSKGDTVSAVKKVPVPPRPIMPGFVKKLVGKLKKLK